MGYPISGGQRFGPQNPPQQLGTGFNSMGPGGMSLVQPRNKYGLPGQSGGAAWRPENRSGGGLQKAGGLLSLLGGPAGAIGLGMTAVGTIAGLFGGDPYKKLAQRTRKRFSLMRSLATRQVGQGSAASINRARQGMAGQGLTDSAVFGQMARGYEHDYATQLSDMQLRLMAEEEDAMAEIEGARTEYKHQGRLGLTGLAGSGLSLLMGSLNPRNNPSGGS